MRGGWGGGGEKVLGWKMCEIGSWVGVTRQVILGKGEFNGIYT